ALAQKFSATLGFLGEAANSVGGALAGLPQGAHAGAMLGQPRKAYLLVNAEPDLDCADSGAALAALRGAELVVALSAFRHAAADYAQVMLPIAPFAETSGTFVSTEGRVQGFQAVVGPQGEARPGWKVLRVLGNLLGLAGFDYDSADQVRDDCLGTGAVAARLSNRIDVTRDAAVAQADGIQRIADVPIYHADALARRAPALQRTRDAQAPRAWMNAKLMKKLGVAEGQIVVVRQAGEARLAAALDEHLPDDCVRVAAGHPLTGGLGAMFGPVKLEKGAAQQAA
ncbi:MAG: molybdopterin-dependent oxidoreductase, partial [Betaproteobacteria bacterium]|nr:molybdopterin-dependent oxidoreductase [Betaproteobacteria bacterium]